MNKKKIAILFVAAFTAISITGGCGKGKAVSPLDGKWSYIYDTETTSMKISGDSIVLDGVKSEYRYDTDRIYLKDKKGIETGLRYELDDNGVLYLYKQSTYEYKGEGAPEGIIGYWVDTDNGNSSFEFTDQGTFREDSYIPGFYSVTETGKNEGTILFVYNDQYMDTTIYYSLKDNLLMVEYPWPMVPTTK